MRQPVVKPWTPQDVEKLETLLDAGASAVRASAALSRSIVSVQSKAREIGKPFPHKRAVKKARLDKEAKAISRQ